MPTSIQGPRKRGFEREAVRRPVAMQRPVVIARSPEWTFTKPDPGEGPWALCNARGAWWTGATRCDVPLTTVLEAEARRFTTEAEALGAAPYGFGAIELP